MSTDLWVHYNEAEREVVCFKVYHKQYNYIKMTQPPDAMLPVVRGGDHVQHWESGHSVHEECNRSFLAIQLVKENYLHRQRRELDNEFVSIVNTTETNTI